MSKIAVIGDTHFHSFKEHSTILPDGMNSRLATALNVLSNVLKDAAEAGVTEVFMLGDIYHVRGTIKPSVQNAVMAVFTRFTTEYDLKFYIIPGNHDLENYRSGDSAIDALSLIDGVHIFFEPSVIHTDAGLAVLGIPYRSTTEAFKDAYESLPEMSGPLSMVLMHQYIDDFTPAVMPRSGITVEYLCEHAGVGRDALAFCGHYHDFQATTSGVINVGAMLPIRFGDDKFGHYVVSNVDTSGPVAFLHTLSFPAIEAPRFVTLTELPPTKAALSEACKGNYVRVTVNSVAAAQKAKEKCAAAGALSVVTVVMKDVASMHSETKVLTATEPALMLAEYLDAGDSGVPPEMRKPVIDLYHRVVLGVK